MMLFKGGFYEGILVSLMVREMEEKAQDALLAITLAGPATKNGREHQMEIEIWGNCSGPYPFFLGKHSIHC